MLMCVISKLHCSFEKTGLCTREQGHCESCAPMCLGCNRVLDGLGTHYCASYPMPRVMWRRGVCPLSSHTHVSSESVMKINPLKASRRSRR